MSRSAEARYEMKNAAASAQGMMQVLGPARCIHRLSPHGIEPPSQVPLWNASFAAHQAALSGQRVPHHHAGYPPPAMAPPCVSLCSGGSHSKFRTLTPLAPLPLPPGVASIPGAAANYAKAASGGQLMFAAPVMAHEEDDPAWRHTPRVETYGNKETFNLNPLLANCVLNHDYSRKLWEMGDSFTALLEEARDKVTHVEPWQQGTQRTPSTAFCVLVRMFQLGLREGHLRALLSDQKPAVRCMAYLYLRYVMPPAQLWKWCEPGLYDDTTQTATLCGAATSTVSSWLRDLLTDQKYFGTILPRIPVKIEREMQVKMMLLEESVERATKNQRIVRKLVVGANVRAIYADDNNEPAWYDAVIDAVEKIGDTAKYWVTFPEYGNQELVRLGDIELVGTIDDDDDDDDRDGGTARAAEVPAKAEDRRSRRRRSPSAEYKPRERRRRRDDDDDDGRSRRRRDYDDDDSRSRRRRRRDNDDDADEDRRRRRRDNDDDADDRRRRRRDNDRDDNEKRHRRGRDEEDVERRRRRRDEGEEDDDKRRHRRRRSESPGEELPTASRASDKKSSDKVPATKASEEPPRTGESLLAGDRMKKVLQQQRDAASATSDYARRPQGYKEALALKIDRYTRRDRQDQQHRPSKRDSSPRSSTNKADDDDDDDKDDDSAA
ncbi:hypothetical protein CTAYLR_002259 [Chrysophaeum taylorii]|uniref:Pre-mRNA-splicing factor 38 n=1 Tax=Chrysophaeum taylorii TaxID=2483200 RepID=A0AAD7UQ92_9STRA|nr:hypothetical protein CTAYLR_002259 [Chrysophaeum taylorii]